MSVTDFHKFLSSDPQLLDSCVRTVNVPEVVNGNGGVCPRLRQGRSPNVAAENPSLKNRVAFVLDAESCLDRLYGGYYPDWSCGGQWRHMVTFLATIFGRLQQCNVHITAFFNGAVQPRRFREWSKAENKNRSRAKQALRHISKRATPPPKAFWLPPSTLRTMLRLALRTLNVSVINSVEDHRHEIMAFCWENGYHGVMADDGEIALFNPPRYFSAHSLKLSLQLDVLAREYDIEDVAKTLDLNPDRFGLLAALLGNHILPPYELAEFHLSLVPERKRSNIGFERVIRAVINYVRTLSAIDDYKTISRDVFGTENDPRVALVKESLKYYFNGSKEGYSKQQNLFKKGKKSSSKVSGLSGRIITSGTIRLPAEELAEEEKRKQLNKPKRSEANQSQNLSIVEAVALDIESIHLNENVAKAEHSAANKLSHDEDINGNDAKGMMQCPAEAGDHPMSVVQALASGVEVTPSESGKYPGKSKKEGKMSLDVGNGCLRPVCVQETPPEVKKTAFDRHRQAQMSPYVNQLLDKGEIKLPVLLEGEIFTEFPPAHEVYRPLRQNVYAILFNLHHARYLRRQLEETARDCRRKAEELRKKAEAEINTEDERKSLIAEAEVLTKQSADSKVPPAISYCIREWHPYNGYESPACVEAQELKWPVPTVQRLWFGHSVEDKQKRLHAFMSCLRCDDAKSILVQTNVPQPMLLLACILRYLITVNINNPIIRKSELDAFLVTAFSPELRDDMYLDSLSLESVNVRGVRLASLFMQGVEMALLANDVCGAPVPLQMCLPWTFFDGKLFHANLLRVAKARNIVELCGGRIDIICQVERMRSAILDGLVCLVPSAPQQQLSTAAMRRGRFLLPLHHMHVFSDNFHGQQLFSGRPGRAKFTDKAGGKKKKSGNKSSEGVGKHRQNGTQETSTSI